MNLVTTTPVTDLARDGASFTDRLLDRLDEEPSYDQVEQAIGQLAEIKVLSQWAIGDVLVFMRYRAQFTPKGIWHKDSENVWPVALFDFVRQEYGLALTRTEAEVVEFLCWTSYRYRDFPQGGSGVWLLERGDEIRLWQRNAQDWLTDEAFETYVRKLSGDLREVLDYTSLMQYYHTSSAFPYTARRPTISWTAHNEVSLIAGQKVEPHLRGLDRLEAKRDIAPGLLEQYEQAGTVHVSDLRREKMALASKVRGWTWEAPPPPYLWVVDTEDEQRHVAVEFPPEPSPALRLAQQIVLGATVPHLQTFSGKPPSGIPMTLEGDCIRMLNGEVVAIFRNSEQAAVSAALSALATRLRLIIPH